MRKTFSKLQVGLTKKNMTFRKYMFVSGLSVMDFTTVFPLRLFIIICTLFHDQIYKRAVV